MRVRWSYAPNNGSHSNHEFTNTLLQIVAQGKQFAKETMLCLLVPVTRSWRRRTVLQVEARGQSLTCVSLRLTRDQVCLVKDLEAFSL
ncbi:hypothetical protein NDU88_004497 [Pleurodeles waltl]|uniref:Uncharacterized protein n=1 Tax=Pleurodeles waltl TaxID=8319 RepID=A0AAV7SIY5_PLEWA|nr:hypothetical protein NDU88_004497 [Pleurodeles waltl]